ncbi:MAG: tetratricopeptide repeat protein [Candidatus Melainabacteria bacterium]|nr:tetratricopeptide repeat protein [Candidatus Melainabacteria bacterium]
MGSKISNTLLEHLSELLVRHTGLYFPRQRYGDLERMIATAAKDFGYADAQSFIRWLTSACITKRHIEILASHLTVGETYFFRDKASFDVLEEKILPELISIRKGQDQRLRIWSAGCSTGEEAYSIAMSVYKLIPTLKDWQITILATDINARCLLKASKGYFRPWSLRATPQSIKKKFFKETTPGCFQLSAQIRDMVSFSYLNLVEDLYPSVLNNTNALDIIFCRNVLMYLVPEKARQIIQNFSYCLVDKGWLLVSPNDQVSDLVPDFVMAKVAQTIVYRKESTPIGPPIAWTPTASDSPHLSEQVVSLHELTSTAVAVQPPAIPSPELLPSHDTPSSPSMHETTYQRALKLYEANNYKDAAELLHMAAQTGPDNSKVLALLARVYANEGKLDQALAWATKATASDTLNPVCHYLQAIILQEQGKMSEALLHLKKCLYLDHDFVLAHFALGNQAYRKDKTSQAKKHFDNAQSSLRKYNPEEVLLEAEGLTAQRLSEIITSLTTQD